MQVGVEGDWISAIGLNGDDDTGDSILVLGCLTEEFPERFVEALAEQAEEFAVMLEINTEHFGDGDDILAVRDLFEKLGLDPFGKGDDPLLVA
jgi:hypothetical protein